MESEGTLHLTLTRYKNDTCGGYIDESDLCVYLIDLRVETSYWRGGNQSDLYVYLIDLRVETSYWRGGNQSDLYVYLIDLRVETSYWRGGNQSDLYLSRENSDPAIMPYKVVNLRYITLYGIITGSLPDAYSCARYC